MRSTTVNRSRSRTTAALLVMAASALGLTVQAAGVGFIKAVTATHPLAFFTLSSAAGKSEVGSATYQVSGQTGAVTPGHPIGATVNSGLWLDGQNGYVQTTLAGGIGQAASVLAWIHLGELPATAGHFFYVAGESQVGNDLDLQIETDNVLRFYTAAGSHIEFAPPPGTLVHRWHMVVATLDTVSGERVLYWDGKAVASDRGGGTADKTAPFSIGASPIFGGRNFEGRIGDVAFWNRALSAEEVAALYAASGAAGGASVSAGPSASSAGPFTTTGNVEASDSRGPIALKPAEKIALMILIAIEQIEGDSVMEAHHACSLDELVAGPVRADGSLIGRLKADPRQDPNYTYTVNASGTAWEAHATAKKPGLAGFCFFAKGITIADATYNPSGTASVVDDQLTSRSVEGDTFVSH